MTKDNSRGLPSLRFSSFKDLEQLFGPPPIISGEDAEAYRAIGQAIWDARPPEDFIQATRINDIAYLLWEGNRLRRLKVKLIEASRIEGARKLIKRLSGEYSDAVFWGNWAQGEESTTNYVNDLLASCNLDHDTIVAQTIDVIVDTLEAIERQSAQFEARRLVTTRDYDQYSDNAARRKESTEERTKRIGGQRSRKPRVNQEKNEQPSPQLPLDLEAAE